MFGILCAIWTFLGILCAAQIYLKSILANDGTVTVFRALRYALPIWMIWIPATYGVIDICRRFNFEPGKRIKSFLVHFIASIGLGLLHMLFHACWLVVLNENISLSYYHVTAQTINLFDDIWLQLDLLIYWAIVAAYFSFNYYRQFRKRQVQQVRMESQLNQARIKALKAQVHPHFLFNTLSALQTMVMRKGANDAAQMITKLSDYLRTTLQEDGRQMLPLKEEIDFIRQYLEIEEYRFGDRLEVHYDIQKETYDLQISNLLLQPIVENAIQHGLSPKEDPMKLSITALKQDDHLKIEINDNGSGKNSDRVSLGTGLQRTRERLQEIYGKDYDFKCGYRKEGGFKVMIKIPAIEFNEGMVDNYNNEMQPVYP